MRASVRRRLARAIHRYNMTSRISAIVKSLYDITDSS